MNWMEELINTLIRAEMRLMNTLEFVAKEDFPAAKNFHTEMGIELERAKRLLAYLGALGLNIEKPGQKWSELAQHFYEVEYLLNRVMACVSD